MIEKFINGDYVAVIILVVEKCIEPKGDIWVSLLFSLCVCARTHFKDLIIQQQSSDTPFPDKNSCLAGFFLCVCFRIDLWISEKLNLLAKNIKI